MTQSQVDPDRAGRRRVLHSLLALPLAAWLPGVGQAQELPDFARLKAGYAHRLKKILGAGKLPYIDIESSCDPEHVDVAGIAQSMDELNIGLMALSSDVGKGVYFDKLSDRLVASYPDHFIPVGNGCKPPALTDYPVPFIDAQEAAAHKKQMMILGEYEFRHYPSPRQVKRGRTDRDVNVPIDGPAGHHLFQLSEKLGMAFQLHYEIEDELLAPLEKMLTQYPKAKVIWCHLTQIRYIERASRYSAAYVDGLIQRFPNLYFDTAFGDANSVYPVSKQRHSRIWAGDGGIKPEWADLIAAHPHRFLSALDLGGDRLDRIVEYDQKHRNFLSRLPKDAQHQLAYRSAWALLFGEEFS